MALVTKYRGNRGYLYRQHSRRVNGKVVTDSEYLGPADGYVIEPGERAAYDAIVSDIEKGVAEKRTAEQEAAKFKQDEFLKDTEVAKDEGPPSEED